MIRPVTEIMPLMVFFIKKTEYCLLFHLTFLVHNIMSYSLICAFTLEIRINNDGTSCLSIKSKLQTEKNSVRLNFFFTFKNLLCFNSRNNNESLVL